MVEVIHWCLELGVRYVTVYAFSIDNFQREAREVKDLMHLAEDKFAELAAVSSLGCSVGSRWEMHPQWPIVQALAACVPAWCGWA